MTDVTEAKESCRKEAAQAPTCLPHQHSPMRRHHPGAHRAGIVTEPLITRARRRHGHATTTPGQTHPTGAGGEPPPTGTANVPQRFVFGTRWVMNHEYWHMGSAAWDVTGSGGLLSATGLLRTSPDLRPTAAFTGEGVDPPVVSSSVHASSPAGEWNPQAAGLGQPPGAVAPREPWSRLPSFPGDWRGEVAFGRV